MENYYPLSHFIVLADGYCIMDLFATKISLESVLTQQIDHIVFVNEESITENSIILDGIWFCGIKNIQVMLVLDEDVEIMHFHTTMECLL